LSSDRGLPQLLARQNKLGQLKEPFLAIVEVHKQPPMEKRLVNATAKRNRLGRLRQKSFLVSLRQFLTPQVWKQAQQRRRPAKSDERWCLQALVYVLLAMTWCAGDSEPERFEMARAFYVAHYQRSRRPGKSIQGYHKALARLALPVLRALAEGVRQRMTRLFGGSLFYQGFIPMGCDGSRLECPRSAELEKRLGQAARDNAAPSIWVTAMVHLSTGMLWSWRLGKGTGSEEKHLVHLLATLLPCTLLVCDAGFVGYELFRAVQQAQLSFLIRLCSRAYLYTEEQVEIADFREGEMFYWPQWAQEKKLPPLRVRLLRVRDRGCKHDVWLLTNVLERSKLGRKTAAQFYRWRWRNEGLFRTYKRTLHKVKLVGRTVVQVHREAEGSLLALQLLLAEGALALAQGRDTLITLGSRQLLLRVRAEITLQIGANLGPRQQAHYVLSMARARAERRPQRSAKVRRPWPTRRKDHKPPKPPVIRQMTDRQKALKNKVLQAARTSNRF
jgi:Transposase DDE domain